MKGNKTIKPTAAASLQLLGSVIQELGVVPKILHSDLGTEFNNKSIKSYCIINEILLSFCGNDVSGFGNQFIENLNGKFKNVFLKSKGCGLDVESLLREFCIGHNLAQHRGNLLGNSPIVTYYALMNSDLEREFPI